MNAIEKNIMPQAPDMERKLIGACLYLGKVAIERVPFLRPDMFYEDKHRAIFEVICALRTAGDPVDILTVTRRLKATNRLEEAGGGEFSC